MVRLYPYGARIAFGVQPAMRKTKNLQGAVGCDGCEAGCGLTKTFHTWFGSV